MFGISRGYYSVIYLLAVTILSNIMQTLVYDQITDKALIKYSMQLFVLAQLHCWIWMFLLWLFLYKISPPTYSLPTDWISIMCTTFINKIGMFFKSKPKKVNLSELLGFYMPQCHSLRDNWCHMSALYFYNNYSLC